MSNLFNAETPSEIDPTKNYLEELVGENRKFRSTEDLARGKAEADAYINQLKAQLDEAKQELRTRESLEELLTKRETPKFAPRNEDQPQVDHTMEMDRNVNEFTPEKLEALLEEKLTQRESQRSRERNFTTVQADLNKAYGANTQVVLTKVQEELGVSKDWLNALAGDNPKAFMKLVSDTAPKSTQSPSLFAPPTSQIRSDAFRPDDTMRGWAYYQKLKASNPKEYESERVQMDMHRDALKLGERFYD